MSIDSFTNDLNLATRELFIRTKKSQIFMQTPVLEALERRSKITIRGGKYIERLVDTAEMDDLGQSYIATTALTDEKKEMLNKPRFYWKNFQIPLRYDLDEYADNISGGNDTQLLDLAQFLVEKGQRASRLYLQKMIYNVNPMTGAGSETGVADNSIFFNSLLSALDHDVTTYGTVTRALNSATTSWWMSPDPTGRADKVSSSTQNTAVNISVANLRKWFVPILQYADTTRDLYVVMCPTLWNKVRAELEARGTVSLDKDRLSYGIQAFDLDGATIVSDPYLEHGYGTANTTENWVFILNLNDWELRIHTKRDFLKTDFVWQGDRSNGFDGWLARIMTRGNFMCWKPNGSMWLQNVS